MNDCEWLTFVKFFNHCWRLLISLVLFLQFCFDYKPGDIYACVADIGWITGHSYVVYGPLCNGATTVLFESTPTYPDPGRYWEMVERLRVNQFYGAPTSIRLLLRYGDKYVKQYDRSSLRVLGTGRVTCKFDDKALFSFI